MLLQQSALMSVALILLTAPSTLAANCIRTTGMNTQDLNTADLKSNINGICDSFWRGHTSSTVQEAHVICKATSSTGTYKFCNMALTNIAAQCGGVSEGNFEYHWQGTNEFYVCKGFVGTNGGSCNKKRDPKAKSPPKTGDPCLKSRGDGKIWEVEVEQEEEAERETKTAVEWTG
jgi:hypothetical protein